MLINPQAYGMVVLSCFELFRDRVTFMRYTTCPRKVDSSRGHGSSLIAVYVHRLFS